MTIEQLKGLLEPFYQDLDHVVDDLIRPAISPQKFKYFEACRFKVKAIWYIYKRIETFDKQYKELLSLCIAENSLQKLSLSGDKDSYYYFPFHEALEFENLLSTGKACLDCFSKAIGSVYGQSPNNIHKLTSVLMSIPRDEKSRQILGWINEFYRLKGVIIDPKSDKQKSLRDLITHRERIDISFLISLDSETAKYRLSHGALLNMKRVDISRIPNYLVTNISGKVWHHLLGIIENCFKILFDDGLKNHFGSGPAWRPCLRSPDHPASRREEP